MIAYIMLGQTIFVIAAHDRIPQMQVFDLGLQFAAVTAGNFPAKDHGQFVGFAQITIAIQQSFPD